MDPNKPKVATLVAIPKPFTGETAVLQRAACKSWASIPGLEVILAGDEEGIAETCRAFMFQHIRDVMRTEQGTPRLNDVFTKAREKATTPLLLYVNADIILGPEIIRAAQHMPFPDFLLAGRRYDVEPWEEEADADYNAWHHYAINQGILLPACSSDYFLLPVASRIFVDMPPLVVGRSGWDNWMMYRARELSIPLIDGTEGVISIHRKHGYNHIQRNMEDKPYSSWDGVESRLQIAILGERLLDLGFATHRMDGQQQVHPVKKGYSRLKQKAIIRRIRAVNGPERFFWQLCKKVYYLFSNGQEKGASS
ncbi:MAG: hypothetical protein INR73_22470 [Williamsia sp.]|nr:hypothetical protein [Williamsia sp.]